VIRDFSNEIPKRPAVPEILCIPPEETFGLQAKACGSIHKIYISTSGLVSACNFLSGGVFGEMSSQSLEDILEARALHARSDLYLSHPVLAGCPQCEKNCAS
jgi:hypothetical protein